MMDNNGVHITNREIYDTVVDVENTLNRMLRTYVSWKALAGVAAVLIPLGGLVVAIWP